jgi:hypothetical protein
MDGLDSSDENDVDRSGCIAPAQGLHPHFDVVAQGRETAFLSGTNMLQKVYALDSIMLHKAYYKNGLGSRVRRSL